LTPPPSVLLFDLGGVLVDNAIFEDLPDLLPTPLPKGDLHELWLSSPAVRRFERGEIDADAFAAQFVSEWGLTLAPSAFLERFATWPKGFFAGAGPLLTRLRRRYRIAYLSNSNAVHWRGFSDILSHADVAYASHICGLVKPDPALFRLVVDDLGCAPGDICFFDDSAGNVRAAQAFGLDAHLTVGVDQLTAKLQALGLGGAAIEAP
jgi:putative hydrolase of the HAD superfamily